MTLPPVSTLTPMPRLSEWILITLLDLRSPAGESHSQDVILRIGELFDDLLTEADLQPDPRRPGVLIWQSRVHLARRYLGEDELVVSNRRYWRLTEAGRRAAVEFLRSVLCTSSRQAEPPSEPAAPQAELPREPPGTRSAEGSDVALPVVIELNMRHQDGLGEAYELLTRMWRSMDLGSVPGLSDGCVYTTMSISQLRSFIGEDRLRPMSERAVYRVWPDVPLVPPATKDVGRYIRQIPAQR
jgi:hypothetical protein